MFKKVIVPDFSSRGEAVAPPDVSGRSLPPIIVTAPPPPVDYNKPQPLPEFIPQQEVFHPSIMSVIPTVGVVNSFVPVISQLSPEGTYSGINNPKFLINPSGDGTGGGGSQGPQGAQGAQGSQGPQGVPGGGGVTSLNTLTGAVTIGPGTAIGVVRVGQNIDITNLEPANRWANFSAINNVDLAGFRIDDASTIESASLTVRGTTTLSLQAIQDLQIASQGTFGAAGQVLTSDGTYTTWQTPGSQGVTSINAETGAITVTAGTGISVGTSGSTITVSATGGGTVDLNGLLNKINAFPALPFTAASFSDPVNNQVPTAVVPDGSFPVNVPTVGAVPGGWGFSKASGSAAYFNWYQYNPRFGVGPWLAVINYVPTNRVFRGGILYECILANINQQPPNATYWIVISPSVLPPLPYVKSQIQSAWVLIRPTVNLYLAGYLAINLYSFDDTNTPTSGFFNTRWAYSNSVGAVAGATGTNLFAGYTYLLYANDSPRITNSSAIGVPDAQVSGLRDPYDIYTDVNHIPLQNCVVAFNPWTDGTYYQTWTQTGVYPLGAEVVFAGFGTNFNGLFFVVTGVPVVGVAPMVNGVVSAGWALISPQPSSFANQPVVGITVTQSTASSQAVGYVVLDIGFSYGPSTTSTTVSEHIQLIPN